MNEHNKIMDRLLSLPAVTLVTTGRTGTDFLQSLLDSHPEVLTFNGSLFFYEFWFESKCVSVNNFDLDDLLDEFVGKHIEKFKSRYDLMERKDQLGIDGSQVIEIDLMQFKQEMRTLLADRTIDSKTFLVAVYAAYERCLGNDLEKKKVFFHHQHHFDYLDKFFKDFPEAKTICMTRDPRANFVSGIENWIKIDPERNCAKHLFQYINRILDDAKVLRDYKNEYLVVRIEDLGEDENIKELCEWLGIVYHECLQRSTWGGLLWHGDRLSKEGKKEVGFSKKILENRWETRLSGLDKYIFNYLMNERLRFYGYEYKSLRTIDSFLVPFAVIIPLRFELRFFSFSYIAKYVNDKNYRKLFNNAFFYVLRIVLFLKYYVISLRGEKLSHVVLGKKS